MLANESVYQLLMSEDTDYVHVANQLSLQTAEEKKAYSGTKPFEPNKELDPMHPIDGDLAEGMTLAQDDSLWNTTWPRNVSTYQWIHDQ